MTGPSRVQLKDCLIGIVLVGLTLFSFWSLLDADFINFDDPVYVTENANIQAGLRWDRILWAFQTFDGSNWHPLTWMSHMLDWQLYGPSPTGHHLTNLLLHTGNGLLLYLILRLATGSMWRSAAVAALFLCHPQHVESVAWISERKDVLSTFFGMSSLLCYVRYVHSNRKLRWLLVSLGLFALSLMAKPMLVTLPFLLLLLDVWPLERRSLQAPALEASPVPPADEKWARLLAEKAPFLLLTIASSVVTLIAQRNEQATLQDLPFWGRLTNAMVAYGAYLGKTIWPAGFSIFYPHPRAWPLGRILVSVAVLQLISIAFLPRRKTMPWLMIGWLWFLGTLVPVIGIVQVGFQSMADRYSYFPLIGIFIVLAWGIPALLPKTPSFQRALAFVGVLAVGLCAVQTAVQARYWRTSETLFGHALTIDPHNAIALNNYGIALAQRGALDEAIRCFSESVRILPQNGEAQYDLGLALFRQKKLDEAAAALVTALKYQPGSPNTRNTLGAVYYEQKKYEDAALQFKDSLRLNPNQPDALHYLGSTYERREDIENALLCYQKAIALRPDFYDAHLRMGVLQAKGGHPEEALVHFKKVLEGHPDSPELYDRIGNLLLELKQWPEAANNYRKALELNAGDVLALYQLGGIALKENKREDARRFFNEVLRLQPDHADAREQLSRLTGDPAKE